MTSRQRQRRLIGDLAKVRREGRRYHAFYRGYQAGRAGRPGTDAGAAYRAGAFFGDAVPAGWPDITGVLPDGRFIGVECKAPGGRQSPAQKLVEQAIRQRKGIHILARCAEDVMEGIEDAARR